MDNPFKKINNYIKKSNQAFNQINSNLFNSSNSNLAKNIFFHGDLELIAKIPDSDSLYNACSINGIELLFFDSEEKLLYFRTKEGTVLITDFYFAIMFQMFVQKLYI
jgi:hypothetical protein